MRQIPVDSAILLFMKIIAVRGAVTVDNLEGEQQSMIDAVRRLMSSLFERNGINAGMIISLQFTQTVDLRIMNAATAFRLAMPGFEKVPLFCSQEPDIVGSLPRTIRVLVTWTGTGKPVPVYLGDTRNLRPDLAILR